MQNTKICPACESLKINLHKELYFKNLGLLKLKKCNSCRHFWLDTVNTHNSIEEIYNENYSGHIIDKKFDYECKQVLENELNDLKSPPANLLDVGCGNGSFVIESEKKGYISLGIDISQDAIDYGKSRGANVRRIDFIEHDFGTKFDVITMWDVVEHLQYPLTFLKRAKSLLNKNGILLIKTPSINPISFSTLSLNKKLFSLILSAPEHVQYWNKSSMNRILKNIGFENPIYFKSRQFRSLPETKSKIKILKRFVIKNLRKFYGCKNLFLAVQLK